MNVTMSPVSIKLLCDSPVVVKDMNTKRKGAMMNLSMGNIDENTAYVYYDIPPLTPGDQLRVILQSDKPFKILQVLQGN